MSSTVFIADDEALLLRTLSNALRDAGFEVLSSRARSRARPCSEREEFVDIMVLDVKLPGKSGLDLLQSQRERGTPVP
ncbi:MAG: response regulator [Candidatus Eisenbacteria bacterium]